MNKVAGFERRAGEIGRVSLLVVLLWDLLEG